MVDVIPSHWHPHHRADDHELVGYTVDDGDGAVPVSLLGHPLAAPGELRHAMAVLEQRGLAVLAEPWWLTAGETSVEVRVLAAYPDRVTVVEAPYGFFGPDSPRHTLEVPAEGLIRAPRR